MQNGTSDSDIIFELETGEVMRLEQADGSDEALRLNGTNWIRFGDDDISMRNNGADNLVIRNYVSDGDILFRVNDVGNEFLRVNGDANGAHLVDISAATEIDKKLTLADTLIFGTTAGQTSRIGLVSRDLTMTNDDLNQDIVFVGNKGGTPTEILRLLGETNTTRVLDILEVRNTINDENGAKLDLKKLRPGAPIDNDEVAVINVTGKNSSLDEEEFAKIRMTAKEVADGSEQGTIEFWVRNAGASTYKIMDMTTTADSTVTVTGHMDVKGDLSANRFIFRNAIFPETPGGSTIGTETNEWGDLFLYDNKAIKFGAAQDATITHGSGSLTIEATNTDIVNKLRVADEFLLGAGKDEFSITEASDDITIKNTVNDKDIIFSASTGDAAVEVMRLDGDASSLRMTAAKKLEFAAGTNFINFATYLNVNAATIKMSKNTGTNDNDYDLTIEKEIAEEVLQADQGSEPLWTLENT